MKPTDPGFYWVHWHEAFKDPDVIIVRLWGDGEVDVPGDEYGYVVRNFKWLHEKPLRSPYECGAI